MEAAVKWLGAGLFGAACAIAYAVAVGHFGADWWLWGLVAIGCALAGLALLDE